MTGFTISDMLRRAAQRRPDHLAYVYDAQEHCWAEVDERVDRLANLLLSKGVGKGDVVASCSLDGPVTVEVLFALGRIGAIRVGVNYRFTPDEVAALLAHCGARLLILQEDFADLAGALAPEIEVILAGDGQRALGDYERLLAAADPGDCGVSVAETDVAQICYTTGSTGMPKGAVWTHRNHLHSASQTLLDFGYGWDDVHLHCLPAAGVPSVLATWNVVMGFTNVIMKAFDPVAALEAIQNHGVTRTIWVPTMLLGVCEQADKTPYDLSSMRRISYGSAPATTALIRRGMKTFPGTGFEQWYGSTEGAGGWFTLLTTEDHERAVAGEEDLLKSCGQALHHADVSIQGGDGNVLPAGEIGEVCMRGAFVMREYFKNPEQTAETLAGGWLHTGDMGRMDARGYVYLVDRKQFMIITGGYNVYPIDVENAIAAHPAVSEVCVFGVPDEKWGEAVYALVVLREGATATAEDILDLCRESLAKFKVPKAVEFRDSLMRGPTGKLLKRAHKDEFWMDARG